jgi:hypothetical protein
MPWPKRRAAELLDPNGPVGGEGHSGDPTKREKLMKNHCYQEDQVLRRLCMLKKTSKTGYLARLAKEQAKQELLRYAAEDTWEEGRP